MALQITFEPKPSIHAAQRPVNSGNGRKVDKLGLATRVPSSVTSTGHIAHHAAKSLIFALPLAGSQPKRTPVPWDAAQPYRGLGYREVEAEPKKVEYVITELPVQKA